MSFTWRFTSSKLLAGVNDWARRHGLEELKLHVWRKNCRAIALYESLGYEITRHTMRRRLRQIAGSR